MAPQTDLLVLLILAELSLNEAGVCEAGKPNLSTHSNTKKRPQVSRRSPRVRGKTPLCRAMMSRPPQQKRFFPGKTSHLLLGLLRSSPPSRAGGAGAGGGRARGSICSYSQLSMLEFGSVPVRTSGASAQHPTPPRHSAAAAIPRKTLLPEGGHM